jgi:SSS family solute:Na+ symporter
LADALEAAETKPLLKSYFGKTPSVDGELSFGEWNDATQFRGVRDWVAEFSPVVRNKDLALRGYVKHDTEWLYFAFDVTDDVLYGINTPRWLPDENPKAHDLTRDGYPWFGDEMELLLNATGKWKGEEEAEGNGSSWQMVCNLTKSRLGGIGVGGLLEGEPRRLESAWNTYQAWIMSGAQKAAVKPKRSGKGYVIEWAVRFNPCLEMSSGQFYSLASGQVDMGLNIAVGDLDEAERGRGNFGHFHHEQWLAGIPHLRTQKRYWGTLRMMGRERNPSVPPR